MMMMMAQNGSKLIQTVSSYFNTKQAMLLCTEHLVMHLFLELTELFSFFSVIVLEM
jgi:hypothetical protein